MNAPSNVLTAEKSAQKPERSLQLRYIKTMSNTIKVDSESFVYKLSYIPQEGTAQTAFITAANCDEAEANLLKTLEPQGLDLAAAQIRILPTALMLPTTPRWMPM